jgi:hypothetical protein
MEVLEEGRKNSFSDLNSFYEPPDSWNTPKFTEIEEWNSLDLNFLEIFQNSKTQPKEIKKRDNNSFIKHDISLKKIQIRDQDSSEGSPRKFIDSPKLPDSPASGSEDLETKERVVTKSFSIFSKQKSTSTAVSVTNPHGEQSSSSSNLLENIKSKLNIKKELSTLKKDTPQSMSSRFRSTFFKKDEKKSARMTLKTPVNIPILPISNLNSTGNVSADPSPRNESIGSPKSRFSGIFTPKMKMNLSPKYSFLQKNTSPPLSDMSSPQKIKPLNKTPKHSPKESDAPNTFRNRVEKPLEAPPESQQEAPNTYRTSKERKTQRTSNPKDSPKKRTFEQYPLNSQAKISLELERNTTMTTTTTSNSSSEGTSMEMKFGTKKGFEIDPNGVKSPHSRRKSSFPEQITRKSSFVKYFQNEQSNKTSGNLVKPTPIHRWESDHQSKKGELQQFVLKRNSDGGSTQDILEPISVKEDDAVYPSNSQIITKEPEILLSNSQVHKRSNVDEFNIISPPTSARHERSQTISTMNFFESGTDSFEEMKPIKKAVTPSMKPEVKPKENSKNSWNLFINRVNQFIKTDTVLTSNSSFANQVPGNMRKPQFDHSVFSELNPFKPGATLNEMLWEAGI